MVLLRRALWGVLALAMIGNLGVGAWLLHNMRYGTGISEDLEKKRELIEVRKALFTDTTHDVALFSESPGEIAKLGFSKDSPETLEAWKSEHLAQIPYLTGVTSESLPTDAVERAKAIALLFSVNGMRGICGGFDGLLDALQRLPDGYGCCSDHSEAFLALGELFGMDVRQVTTAEHAFNEFWDPARSQWVFIDPQYALLARDPDGRPLGAFEVRERLRDQQRFAYEFFGKPVHQFSKESPWSHPYYRDFEPFTSLGVTWGNTIFTQDRLEERLGWMPRAGRQLVGHISGAFPDSLLYEDADAAEAKRLRHKRQLVIALVIGLPLGTVLPPIALRALRRRSRPMRGPS